MEEINGYRGGKIKAFVEGVEFEQAAREQVHNIAALPFIHEHVAVMPDVHFGRGATVGSVIPTKGAIIPAAVGVDLGCGMMAIRTSLVANQLPDSLAKFRSDLERAVPHGGPGPSGEWTSRSGTPNSVISRWRGLEDRFDDIATKENGFKNAHYMTQLGTLGGGNHFIELCLDEEQRVWVMLHSGSRGVGNRIGQHYIAKARDLLDKRGVWVPDKDLAWFEEGEDLFTEYVTAVDWAQDYALENRKAMMHQTLRVMRDNFPTGFTTDRLAVNCHHNYVSKETHFGESVYVTRKGAVSAREGELGIIPGSMGAKSFIVRGKGNPDSFCSCSHGAGRRLSRGAAKREFSVADHEKATAGVECRKDAGVLDETPGAYKDIDKVIAAQANLIEVVHTLKQVVCVKG